MTAPRGFIEVVSDYDALPGLVAIDAIAVVSKATPTAGDAKAVILLKGGERLAVATAYECNCGADRAKRRRGSDEKREIRYACNKCDRRSHRSHHRA